MTARTPRRMAVSPAIFPRHFAIFNDSANAVTFPECFAASLIASFCKRYSVAIVINMRELSWRCTFARKEEKRALMKIRAAVILIAFVSVCTSFNEVRKASIHASDKSEGVERASAANTQSPTSLTPSQENHSYTSLRFEPLLLLLLGSTLISIGTAMKLVLSRKLNPKSLGMRHGNRQAPNTGKY